MYRKVFGCVAWLVVLVLRWKIYVQTIKGFGAAEKAVVKHGKFLCCLCGLDVKIGAEWFITFILREYFLVLPIQNAILEPERHISSQFSSTIYRDTLLIMFWNTWRWTRLKNCLQLPKLMKRTFYSASMYLWALTENNEANWWNCINLFASSTAINLFLKV